eukprot:3367128-Pyramimonas_sp.AAC.2
MVDGVALAQDKAAIALLPQHQWQQQPLIVHVTAPSKPVAKGNAKRCIVEAREVTLLLDNLPYRHTWRRPMRGW